MRRHPAGVTRRDALHIARPWERSVIRSAYPILILSGILLAATPRTAPAWGPEGHQVVGLIAENALSPKARAESARILKGEAMSDTRVANWADFVRANKAYDRRYPDNDKWHYVNIDVTMAESDFRLPLDGNDVVSQVIRWHQELSNPDATDETKRDALRFLVHFVGDLHQPLHCAFRNGDYGGNRLRIHSFRGKSHLLDAADAKKDRLNLHVVWDVALVLEAMQGGTVTNLANELIANADAATTDAWREQAPRAWVWPVHALAVKHAYGFSDGTPLPKAGERISLTQNKYIRSNVPIVREQLLKAGVRLADLVNEALGGD